LSTPFKDLLEQRPVLVTGGAGYLGSCVVRELLARGYRVRTVDAMLHGGAALLEIGDDPALEIVVGDLRDPAVLRHATSGAGAVVHLAAIVGEAAANRDPAATEAINLTASVALLQASQREGTAAFVFASTCSNYGKAAPGYVFDESSPLEPLSVYARTKVETEQALLASPSPGIHVARFATLFGLSPRPRFDLTVNDFTARLWAHGKLELYHGDFWRPYLHVKDAAHAVAQLLERRVSVPQVWNVGSSALNFKKREIAQLARDLVGRGEILDVKGGCDLRDYRVSFARIERELGFAPRRDLQSGVREILAALRSNLVGDPFQPRYSN
jgi:nucleoside-diphosphate-sugar epimerase